MFSGLRHVSILMTKILTTLLLIFLNCVMLLLSISSSSMWITVLAGISCKSALSCTCLMRYQLEQVFDFSWLKASSCRIFCCRHTYWDDCLISIFFFSADCGFSGLRLLEHSAFVTVWIPTLLLYIFPCGTCFHIFNCTCSYLYSPGRFVCLLHMAAASIYCDKLF